MKKKSNDIDIIEDEDLLDLMILDDEFDDIEVESPKKKTSSGKNAKAKSVNSRSTKVNSAKEKVPNNRAYSQPNTASKKRRPRGTKEVALVGVFFVVILVFAIYHYVDFLQNDSDAFIYNTYNARFGTYSEKVVRGDIKTLDGTVVATTVTENGEESRSYPYNQLFSHVVGYVQKGMSGLEKQYSFDLLKTNSSLKEIYENDMNGKKSIGDTMVTTLDYDAQLAAYTKMDYFKGAVVAIEPDTGRIVAMVSKPDFDPNNLDMYWDTITDANSNSSVLLNRATQGLYPPGSTFKIITTLAYLREHNGDYSDFSFNCNGTLQLTDYTIHCSSNKTHGSEDLQDAFANSCNCAFASIGVDLDTKIFNSTASELLFNEELPTDLANVKKSKFVLSKTTDETTTAQTAMGQGDTVVTPLHMALIASAIANDGVLMEPYLVDHFVAEDGTVVNETKPKQYDRLMTEDEAEILQKFMSAVTEYGTADDVDFGNLKVYGKTGTAEYNSNKDDAHSWFVGYAQNDDGEKLAIAVIMEGAGYGSQYAAPLAAAVFEAYFN